jgi:hypothetical protein|tara:strand:+ start:277 stop:468 length:192 start_codon:yes stop_codon:yes gene_type:complete
MEFIQNNWVELLLALITLGSSWTALTATKKDDEILDIIKRVFNAIVLGKNTCAKDCKEECKNK